MVKIKCPECGSDNVIFWKETIVTTHHKIRKDGKPYKNGRIAYTDGNSPYGYQCLHCGEWCSISGGDDEESWQYVYIKEKKK